MAASLSVVALIFIALHFPSVDAKLSKAMSGGALTSMKKLQTALESHAKTTVPDKLQAKAAGYLHLRELCDAEY